MAKIHRDLTHILHSTYLGGSDYDYGVGVDDSVVNACADASRAVGLIVECLAEAGRELP